jgi:amidase
MSVNGPIARTVADAALFLDATVTGGGFSAAAAAPPRPLRIAVSTKAPPGVLLRLGREERAAVERAAETLRGLGHDVVERDPDWPADTWGAGYARVLRGIHDDVEASMPHRERLEKRTRQVAAIGARLGGGAMRWARERERDQAARVLALWDEVDVLLCPSMADGPYRAGEMGRWGTGRYLLRAGERLPYYAGYNLTGQPAANVPAGFDQDGLPMGVQLVGRPGDDATLLALGGQLEEQWRWAERRPPVA